MEEGEGVVAGQLGVLLEEILRAEQEAPWGTMLADDLWARLQVANQRETEAWREVGSRAQWEAFRDERLSALRCSLGVFPPTPSALDVQVTRTLGGDGFRIENLVFESRPGLVVTANLYVPEPVRSRMPGILICHSHHNPKTQPELQDMGMNWARLGAMVLVMDQVGHGERRQQRFGGRQDYASRYFMGMQLHLVGESLMGWMVWDLMRGVDLLLSQSGIDEDAIILIGSVAGGGDPAAVAAGLDPRIRCVIPFNFGGPQPETPYPLPPDAEETFNYAGVPQWESTRCLRLSARDGFMPWVIVGGVAPRCLIYAHEFSWDQEHDPVWRRLRRVFDFYNAEARLAFAHGWGQLSGRPPDSSHCNNVGPPHRQMIYPALCRWFGMETPQQEVQGRLPPEALTSLTGDVVEESRPKKVHELAAELAEELTRAARARLARLDPASRRRKLCGDWASLLGDVEPEGDPTVVSREEKRGHGVLAERIVLRAEQGITVPLLLLLPADGKAGAGTEPDAGGKATGVASTRCPRIAIVLGIAQAGKARFLEERADEIAELLGHGIAVCLPDLRGTGETRRRDAFGLRPAPWPDTTVSPGELMLGQTLLGGRLRDLRSVLRYLRTRGDLHLKNVALWGDAFAPVNPAFLEDPPAGSEDEPQKAEPSGALLALLGALFDEEIRAVVARRGLVGYVSMLSSPFCYVPHDIVVPGVLTAGDLCDVAAALAPRPVRLEGLVDGRNCAVVEPELGRWFEPTWRAYVTHPHRLSIMPHLSDDLVPWLVTALRAS